MSAAEIRTQINEYLQKVQDERFLKVVHSMLDTYIKEQEDTVIGYEADGTPITASEFVEQADAAVEAARNGDYISVEELEKRSEKWLGRTK